MTSPTPPAEPTYADRVYRSPGGIAGGALLLVLGLWLAGDAILRGHGSAPWLALAGLLCGVPLLFAFSIRPAVFAGDDRMRVRNPFRTITLPWAAVADVRAGYSSEVFDQSGTKYQLWSVPVSLRRRKRAARTQVRNAASDPYGRTSSTAGADEQSRLAPADRTIRELRELAERNAGREGAQGGPSVRWAYEVIAPAVAGAILLIVLLAIG
ncbi:MULTISPECIES: PH domain-containing protein [unclassified Streptomyces]|uniref:PH domain-containing protein n=1 Tax=Streptomyces sp. NBC_00060 TaxID=2975636 RepID=A0AAU2GZX7_9ACTN